MFKTNEWGGVYLSPVVNIIIPTETIAPLCTSSSTSYETENFEEFDIF